MIVVLVAVAVAVVLILVVVAIINRNIRVEESDRERALRMARELKGASDKASSHTGIRNSAAHRISALATEAGIDAKVPEVLGALTGLVLIGFAIGYLVTGVLFGIVCALCVPVLVIVGLRAKATNRAKAFDRQFSGALMMVAQSMASGMSVETAFASVARYSPEPLKGELVRMSAEVRFGRLPLDVALARLAERTGSNDVAFLATVTRVQKTSGGGLSSVLESTAKRLEARIRLRGLVDSVTSSARWTSKIIAAIPFVVLAALVFGAPDIGKTFWESPAWPSVIVAIAVLDVLGLYVMKRLYQMKVE